MNLFDLSGKIALVTGSTDGLGKAMAKGLGQAGATVILNGRSSEERLMATMKEFESEGIKCAGYLFDVVDEEKVQASVKQIEAEVGAIDVLFNNAGIIKRIPLIEMTLQEFRQNVDINLSGPFIMAKAVVPGMIAKGGGKIVNTCSMMSELGRTSVGAYAASKGGLKMLTKNMATEWARHNIQVNGIGPGYFKTALTAPLMVPGNPFNEFIISRTPARRWGNPEELVGAAIFLASRASDFVNGHILYVDGGILATIGSPVNEP